MKKIGNVKIYTIKDTAEILNVHRMTIYHWLKKGWVKVRRDYRNLPVFTEKDIENIKKWRNTLR
ncbi:MAG: MerR family transcriptional regulator [Chlamydiae bacterium]|nr:MerR family transcriptional regulator [Chlamydiota bacterium]